MAIPGIQPINVGLPNEAANSDSLYVAFNKVNNNFANLFAYASPYNIFSANTGIGIATNSNAGQVTITNTGVTSITAGTGIIINQSNGNVTISSNLSGNGGGGTVTSVGLIPSARLVVTGSPVTSSGNFNLDLATSGVNAGSYSNPTVTVDAYGRVTAASNGLPSGSVTSVGVTPGAGIQVSGSPVTTNGNITVTNTGVTRINAGSGITVSGPNGNVTISAATSGGTVTSVGVSSSTLTVSGSPIIGAGTIVVNLPNSISLSGNLTVAGNISSGNISATSANITSIMGNISNAVYAVSAGTANTVTTAAQPNITSVGTLTSLSVTGNTGLNQVTANSANVSGNVDAGGNINLSAGQIYYTPVYGSFYSNVTQLNSNTGNAIAMTLNNTNWANGVSIANTSEITVSKTGVYNIQFSAQVTKTDAGVDYVEIFLAKSGNAIPWTNTRLKLDAANEYEVAAWNFVEQANANEYFQLFWGSADADAKLIAIDSANTTLDIDVPSVIVTVTPVGA